MTASIEVTNLTLRVPLFVQNERQTTSWGKLLLSALFDPPHREFRTLLDNVSLSVKDGERVAILGRNGAGKSTLLRALNNVYHPTSGTVSVKGSCQALLNTSLGFNNEATVKENVFLRANAMGIPSSSIVGMLKPILAFSGLEAKSNHRLKTLSSGQRMRLGFAISTELQHDIMLLDEWVGTGDAEFLARAKDRMVRRVGGSKIVMLASHNFALLRDVCNKGMVMERGRVVFYGDLLDAFQAYQAIASKPPATSEGEVVEEEQLNGCIDSIERIGNEIHVSGWVVTESGLMPRYLRLVTGQGEVAGESHERQARPDVKAALGLLNDKCGFRWVLDAKGLPGLEALGGVLQVYGGSSDSAAVGPLTVQGRALAALMESEAV
ncbi:MAG TPA: hypothetical protein DDZ67_00845 [Xanthomonadaceae bacterium]|nr:hypothetical protein [Xanthomonadaceae bacterium]